MRFVTQSHRLTPASNDGADRCSTGRSRAEGAVFGAAFTDGAGDAVNTMTVQGPVERIAVAGRGHGRDQRHRRACCAATARSISPRVYLQPTRGHRAGRGADRAARRGADGRRRDRPLDARAPAVGGGRRRDRLPPGRHRCRTPPRPRRWSRARASARTMPHALIALAHARGHAGALCHRLSARPATDEAGEAAHAWAELYVGGPGLDRLRPGQPLLPGRALHPARLGPRRARRGADPRRLARRRRRKRWT